MRSGVRLSSVVLFTVLAAAVAACGRPVPVAQSPASIAEPPQSTATTATITTVAPTTTSTALLGSVEVQWAEPPVLAFVDGTTDSYVATATVPLIAAYSELGDAEPAEWFNSVTQFGGPRVFLVSRITSDWLEVYLPVQPNGTKGWIRSAEVALEKHNYRAEVDLSDSSVTAWRGDEIILQTSAAHGRADRPTPVGEFYIRDIIVKPTSTGPYGSHILALSGFSEALDTFGGGLPALALHGTNRPELLGGTVSSGCVRLNNTDIAALADVLPLGTPVEIVA